MDIANYCDGSFNVNDIALAHKQLLRLGADSFNNRFGEQFFLIQARDTLVQVDGSYSSTTSISLRAHGGGKVSPSGLPGRPGIFEAEKMSKVLRSQKFVQTIVFVRSCDQGAPRRCLLLARVWSGGELGGCVNMIGADDDYMGAGPKVDEAMVVAVAI